MELPPLFVSLVPLFSVDISLNAAMQLCEVAHVHYDMHVMSCSKLTSGNILSMFI
jgi:hypothetical protein